MTGASGRALAPASRRLVSPSSATVAAEATALTALLAAAAVTVRDAHVWALLGALVAIGVIAATGGRAVIARGPRAARVTVAVIATVAFAVLGAAAVGTLTRAGWRGRLAVAPWDASGGGEVGSVLLVWVVTLAVWGRGLWLAAAPPSPRAGAWSLGLGAATMVGIAVARAAGAHGATRVSTATAACMLLVWFALGSLALALISERKLEREVLGASRARADRTWLTVMAGPLLGVMVVALLASIGPVGKGIIDGIEAIVTGTWWLVATIAHAGASLFGHHHQHLPKQRDHQTSIHKPHHKLPPNRKRQRSGAGATPFIAAGAVAAILAYALLAFWPSGLFGRGRGGSTEAEHEERDSTFSWSHLLAQLTGRLRRLMRGRRRRGADGVAARRAATPAHAFEGDPVRLAYRRMLSTAHGAGHPRSATDTAREFEARLSHDAPDAAPSLHELTRHYEAVRYGRRPPDPAAAARAAGATDEIAAILGRDQEPGRVSTTSTD